MRRKNPASAHQPAAAPAAVAPVAAAPAAAALPLTFSSPTAAIGARVKAVGREFAARGLLDAQPFGEGDTLVHEHLRRCQGALIVAGKAEMSDASTAEGVKKAVLAAAQSEVELLNAAMKTRNEEWVEIVVPDSYVYFRTLEDRQGGNMPPFVGAPGGEQRGEQTWAEYVKHANDNFVLPALMKAAAASASVAPPPAPGMSDAFGQAAGAEDSLIQSIVAARTAATSARASASTSASASAQLVELLRIRRHGDPIPRCRLRSWAIYLVTASEAGKLIYEWSRPGSKIVITYFGAVGSAERLLPRQLEHEYNHNLVNGYGAIEGEAEDEGEDEPVKVVGFPISEGMAGEGKISVKVSEKWTLDLVAKGRAQVKATLKSDTGEEISLPAEGRGPSFHPRFGEEQGALASGLADGAEGCIYFRGYPATTLPLVAHSVTIGSDVIKTQGKPRVVKMNRRRFLEARSSRASMEGRPAAQASAAAASAAEAAATNARIDSIMRQLDQVDSVRQLRQIAAPLAEPTDEQVNSLVDEAVDKRWPVDETLQKLRDLIVSGLRVVEGEEVDRGDDGPSDADDDDDDDGEEEGQPAAAKRPRRDDSQGVVGI